MNIILNDEIQRVIENIKPKKIAVAYIGIDWNRFVELKNNDKLIVSPTIGSNPYAIKQVIDKIGWDNVFFLNELHAKLYIRNKSAFVGSSNLSRNGMEVKGLIEVGVLIKDKDSLNRLTTEFERLIKVSHSQYTSRKSKEIALANLFKKYKKAVANGLIQEAQTQTGFLEYDLLRNDDFYICWYETGEVEYSDQYQRFRSDINDVMHFRNEDKIEEGSWVLAWKITNSFMPDKRNKPCWIFVHDVIKDGVIEKDYLYRSCAIERKSKMKPNFPFVIDDQFIKTFNSLITNEKHSKYFIQKGRKEFNLEFSSKGLTQFIEELKEQYM